MPQLEISFPPVPSHKGNEVSKTLFQMGHCQERLDSAFAEFGEITWNNTGTPEWEELYKKWEDGVRLGREALKAIKAEELAYIRKNRGR